jgi:hypothetical protein
MTNTIALWLGVVLVLAIGADLLANEGEVLMFLARKALEFQEWVTFWR